MVRRLRGRKTRGILCWRPSCILIFNMHIFIIETTSLFARNRTSLSLKMGFPLLFFEHFVYCRQIPPKTDYVHGGSCFRSQGLPKNNVFFSAPPPPKESPNISHRTCQILLPKTFRLLGRPFTFFVVRFFGGAGGRENTLFLGKPCERKLQKNEKKRGISSGTRQYRYPAKKWRFCYFNRADFGSKMKQ